jgi:XTP/dITP diphosphohydrolase
VTESRRIVLASNNAGKAKELMALLAPLGIEIVSQSDFSVPDVEETGLTFVENALIKARHACRITGLPAIADDSGIEVDALNGAPGIYSARFAGEQGNDAANNQKLLELLEGVPAEERTARYQCVMVLLEHETDPTPLIFSGAWEGVIGTAPQGDGGFGYDPLFWLPSRGVTAAEIAPELKNLISHRAKAARQLVDLLDSGRNPTDAEVLNLLS